MNLTTFSLFVITAFAGFPVDPVSGYPRYIFSRSINRFGEVYSTFSERAELTSVGAEFSISPSDSFDFVPSPGYGNVEAFEEQVAEMIDLDMNAAVVRGSLEDAREWAVAQFYDAEKRSKMKPTLTKREVPMPNESLPGKVLTVTSTKNEIDGGDPLVFCHLIEEGSYFCHKTDEDVVDVTSITVTDSPNGTPSILWVACHILQESADSCHVLNARDMVFINNEFTMSSTKEAS